MKNYAGFLHTIFMILLFQDSFSQVLRVCYVPDNRNKGSYKGYTFDGQRMATHSVPKLINPLNFGPTGIVKTAILLVPLNGDPISELTIQKANCGAIFVGSFGGELKKDTLVGSGISKSELSLIRQWSLKAKSNLVVVTQSEAGSWNYIAVNGSGNPNKPTDQGIRTQLFNGPFGNVSSFNHGGSFQGSLSQGNAIALATDKGNKVTIALDKPTNDIILGDVDILTDLGGITEGKNVQKGNDNDILFANLWAYTVELASLNIVKVEERQLTGQVVDQLTLNGIRVAESTPDPTKETPTNKGEPVVLKNVLFNESTDTLLAQSFPELDRLATLMQTRTAIKIRLEGHTDRIGDPGKNLKLSQDRVAAVKRYLIKKGVSATRIETKGYGDKKPICIPPKRGEKCEANRRVELVVTEQ